MYCINDTPLALYTCTQVTVHRCVCVWELDTGTGRITGTGHTCLPRYHGYTRGHTCITRVFVFRLTGGYMCFPCFHGDGLYPWPAR